MKPPGFNQPNVQNRYQGTNSNFNQNRGGNFNQNRPNNQTQNQVYQAPPYQTPTNQVVPYQPPTNGVLKTDFESYIKANDAILKNVQNQNQGLQNQMANVTSLLTSLCTKIHDFGNPNQASSSSTLPSNTIPNPRNEARAITTRSGVSYEGPSIPMPPPFVNPDVVEETSTDHVPPPLTQKVQETNSQTTTKVNQEGIVNNPKTYELKLPYPERRNVEKRQEKDKIQLQKFWKMFKQLHFNISLADALILMPKYTKMLKDLCANKEKLEELANTPLSENVWICPITHKNSDQKRTRERMSDQKLKESKPKPREIMPQLHSPLTKPAPLYIREEEIGGSRKIESKEGSREGEELKLRLDTYWNWMAAMVSRGLELLDST
ncbi:hypothetical protein Tco_0630647 [Tanacetum coccineum]